MLFFNYLLIMIFAVSSVFISCVAIFSSTVVSIFATSILSLFMTIIYIILVAPDVAITEAAVGSAISTIFFLLGVKAIRKNASTPKIKEKVQRLGISFYQASMLKSPLLSVLMLGAIFAGIADAFIEVTKISDEGIKRSYDFYIQNSYNDTGIRNIVTNILASYRGFDTMIENLVITVAAIGVIFILKQKDEKLSQKTGKIEINEDKKL